MSTKILLEISDNTLASFNMNNRNSKIEWYQKAISALQFLYENDIFEDDSKYGENKEKSSPEKLLYILENKVKEQEYIASMKGKKIEHNYFNRLGQLQYDHQNHVEWALQLGKSVPANVLALYPNLVRKYVI